MIVCISANPALDRRLRINHFVLGEVNRAHSAEILPGGKAAHVAMALHALGERVAWIAFLGGAIGEQCASELRQIGIEGVAIQTAAPTRVNLELIDSTGKITEVLEPGGTPQPHEQEEMLGVCERQLRADWKDALVVISGSLPNGMPSQFYSSLTAITRAAGSKVFLDTSGDALRAGVEARPDFVKPNRKEAASLLGRRVDTMAEAHNAAVEIIARGAKSASITLGGEGLIWKESKNGPAWLARPPQLQAISTVGCGDVTLAGFAFAAQQGWRGEQAVRFATACGAANCLAKLEGQITRQDIDRLLPHIEVTRL